MTEPPPVPRPVYQPYPGAPPSQPWQAPPGLPGQPGQPGQPWQAPARTNGFAITSLVTALAQFAVPLPLVLAITAIVTGHIARRQTRERGEGGAGLALAGLIIGYIELVLSVFAIAGLVLLLVVILPLVIQTDVHHDADRFGSDVVAQARAEQVSPRNPELVRRVYFDWYRSSTGAATDVKLADGTSLTFATDADLARNAGKVEFSQSAPFGRKYSCLTLPVAASGPPAVTDGRC